MNYQIRDQTLHFGKFKLIMLESNKAIIIGEIIIGEIQIPNNLG